MDTLTAERVFDSCSRFARFTLSKPITKGFNPIYECPIDISELIFDTDLDEVGSKEMIKEFDELIISDALTHAERLVFPILKGPKDSKIIFNSIDGDYNPNYLPEEEYEFHPHEYYLERLATLNGYEWGGIKE